MLFFIATLLRIRFAAPVERVETTIFNPRVANFHTHCNRYVFPTPRCPGGARSAGAETRAGGQSRPSPVPRSQGRWRHPLSPHR